MQQPRAPANMNDAGSSSQLGSRIADAGAAFSVQRVTEFSKVYRYMLYLTGAWTTAGVVLFIAAPLAASFVLPLCVVTPLAWHWFVMRRAPKLAISLLIFWLVFSAIYLLINATWSLDRPNAYFVGMAVLVLAVALHMTVGTLRLVGARPQRAIAIAFYAGVAIGGLFLCFEVFSEQWFRRLIMSHAAWLLPDPRHLVMDGDRVVILKAYVLNRNIAVWTFLVWPALLVVWRLGLSRKQAIGLTTLLLLPGLPTIFWSEHQTSQLALAAGVMAFAIFVVAPVLFRRLAVAGWAAATLLVVPIAMSAFSIQLYLAPWLVGSAQDRIVLWGYTSQQVWKAPILGVGVGTSSVLSRPGDEDAPRAAGSERRLSIRHHTHNAYLQTWYEAGAVGAMLLFGLGMMVLRQFAQAPIGAEPFLYATFATCAVMAASSFSLWQAWFMFSFGFTAVFAVLGCCIHPSEASRSADLGINHPAVAGSG